MSLTNKNILRVIALITMTIDHIGFVLLNNNIMFRLIGRIAFPIFAYQFVESFLLTSSKIKYFLRLLFCAIVSQPIYMLVFETYTFNILFTFCIIFVYLVILDKNQKNNQLFLIIIFAGMLIFSIFFHIFQFDWGYNGFCISLFFYLYKTKFISLNILNFTYVLYIFYAYHYNPLFAIYICISLILIEIFEIYNLSFNFKINKWLSYLFYPLHLIIILIISKL